MLGSPALLHLSLVVSCLLVWWLHSFCISLVCLLHIFNIVVFYSSICYVFFYISFRVLDIRHHGSLWALLGRLLFSSLEFLHLPLNLISSRQVSSLLFLSFHLSSHRIFALIDTGAAVNLIAEDVLRENKALVKRCVGPSCLRAANGTDLLVREWIALPILVEGKRILVKFAVVESLVGLAILGMPFLKNLRSEIDVVNRRLVTTKGTFKLLSGPLDITDNPVLLSVVGSDVKCEVEKVQCGKIPGGLRQVDSEQKEYKVEGLKGTPEEVLVVALEHCCLQNEERQRLVEVLLEYKSLWAGEPHGRCTVDSHQIELTTKQPLRQRPRRFNEDQQKEIDKQIQSMLSQEVIEPSKSPYSSEIVLVPKPGGTWRFCVDFRLLNKYTIPDRFPLPRLDDLLHAVKGSRYFVALDLCAGYWQILMHPLHQLKTAFRTEKGLFEFKRMPFGLTNAPATFQRIMNSLLGHMSFSGVLVYLDDILIHDSTIEGVLDKLSAVLRILLEAGLTLNLQKSMFFPESIKYLGHRLIDGKLLPDPQRVETLGHVKTPTNNSELRSFLGFFGFYRGYVPHYSEIMLPLTRQLRKGVTITWTDECQTAFEKVVASLRSAALHIPEGVEELRVTTDASHSAIGAVLEAKTVDGWHPIEFVSKGLVGPQLNWPTREKEGFAIVFALQKFDVFIRGRHVTVQTDHHSLQWLMEAKAGKLARWAALLCEYDLTIVYCPGTQMEHVDFLSRHIENADPIEFPFRAECPAVLSIVSSSLFVNQRFLFPLYVLICKFLVKYSFIVNSKVLNSFISFVLIVWSSFALRRLLNVLKVNVPVKINSFSFVGSVLPLVKSGLPFLDELKAEQRKFPPPSGRGYQLHDGLVFYIGRLWVPQTLRLRVISSFHDIPPFLHPGVRKTRAAVIKFFAWPDLFNDIRKYLKSCLVCQRNRSNTRLDSKRSTCRRHAFLRQFTSIFGRQQFVELITMCLLSLTV